MKKEFGAVEAAGSDRVPVKEKESFADRKRTKEGLIIPPGLVPWLDFVNANADIDLDDDRVRRRKRFEPETGVCYVMDDDKERQTAYVELLQHFAYDTKRFAEALRVYLRDHDAEMMINPRGSKGLSARQMELPRLKILLLPMFFHSALTDDEKKGERMQGIRELPECMIHFSEDGQFQTVRFRKPRNHKEVWIYMKLSEVIFQRKKEIETAYRSTDFQAFAEIIGDTLVNIVREMNNTRA